AALPRHGPVDQGRRGVHQGQAGRSFRAAEEALPDARRCAAQGLVRGTAQGHALAAGGEQGVDREFGAVQRPGRTAQGRREAQLLRRPVHQRIRQLTERPMRHLPALAALLAVSVSGQPAAALDDVVIAMPNFTFTSTPNLVAEELGLWAKYG